MKLHFGARVQYFDKLGHGSADFWTQGNEATYGFLRQAEIKHGRVAIMAAFVGFVVQSNGIHFPFPMVGLACTYSESHANTQGHWLPPS